MRKPEVLDELKTKYAADRLLVLKLDVTKQQDVLDAFAAAQAKFGRVDVVLNNAGIGLFGEVEGTPDATARKVLETNFWGAANVSREAVRFFREENVPKGGRLINVSTLAAGKPTAGIGFYGARYVYNFLLIIFVC